MKALSALAALSAAIAVAAGAFGAHGASGQAVDWLKIGGFYQLTHAIAVLALLDKGHDRTAGLLLGGSALFSATLYLMAMGLPRWLGAITPIGGAIMIAGWLCLAFSFARARR